jgi:hypothetical protein
MMDVASGRPLVFETLNARYEGGVVFTEIAAPPMNLLERLWSRRSLRSPKLDSEQFPAREGFSTSPLARSWQGFGSDTER